MQLPDEIRFELTSRCNYNCDFCYNPLDKKDLSFDNIKLIIDKIHLSGIKAIRFTGGEPFMRPDLLEILKYTKYKNFYIILNSNISLFNDSNQELFDYVDQLLVSFHYLKDVEIMKQKIKKIKFLGPYVRIATILTKDNIQNLESFYKEIKFINPDSWILLRQLPNEKIPFPLNKKDISLACNKIIIFNKKYNFHTFIANSVPFCIDNKLKDICLGGKFDSGWTNFVIDSQGSIKSDYFDSTIYGNALKDNLLDIWNKISPTIPDICIDCIHLEKCKCALKNDYLRQT